MNVHGCSCLALPPSCTHNHYVLSQLAHAEHTCMHAVLRVLVTYCICIECSHSHAQVHMLTLHTHVITDSSSYSAAGGSVEPAHSNKQC
jgi:hypothetical protein